MALETRRNGVLHATEIFSGEKNGEDYRYGAVYKDNEGTINENEFVVAAGSFHSIYLALEGQCP